MRKKDVLAAILIKSGIMQILHKARLVFKRELTVLAYHRILDLSDAENYPYDIEVIDASVSAFDEQMQFIKSHYNPISIQDLQNHIRQNKPLPKNPILITFDDGFDDNYYNAYPVLKKHNIPASIFISTDYVGTDEPFWFERLSRLILTSTLADLSIPEINFNTALPASISARRRIYEACVEKLKYIGKEKNAEIIKALEQKHYQPSAEQLHRYQQLSKPLNWQQCKEMSADIFTIGSHGTSHTILTQLQSDELDDELLESKEAIESNIQQPVTAFSFPNGQEPDFNHDIIRKMIACGYNICFSYLHGTNSYQDIGKGALKRLHVSTKNLAKFKLSLALPEIF